MRTKTVVQKSILPLLILCGSNALIAANTKDYLTTPLSPYNAAIGGQQAHTMPVQAAAVVNPAFLGYGTQDAFFASGALSSDITAFSLAGALYSPFGGLTMAASYLQADDKSAALQFGYGSFLSRRVATGLSITPRYTNSGSAQAFGFGVDPSLLFDSKWHTAFSGGDGFGFYSPSVFFRTQNLAIPIGDSNLLASPSAHVGVLSGIYQSGTLNIALMTSTYGMGQFDRIPFSVGLQTQYRYLLVSAGYSASNYTNNNNGVSLGVGAQIPFAFGDAFFFYNLAFANDSRNAVHSISAGARLGGGDTEPPEVAFASEGNFFSPNNDGVRDTIGFSAKVSDTSPIVYYELQIRDSKGNLVFRQKADERLREKDFSWKLFFSSFIAPRSRSDVPTHFAWNGRIMTEKKKPVKDAVFEEEAEEKVLPDGAYVWEFWAIDEKNNESKHLTGEIIIDTKAPIATVELGDDLISPNGDGNRDYLPITQDTSAVDAYEGAIVDAHGQSVRTFRWPQNAPTRLDFDGKKDNGDDAEEGVYRYRLTGSDAAGNRTVALSGNFYISRRHDDVFLKSAALGFNPLNKSMPEAVFTPVATYGDGYSEGEIRIYKSCTATKDEPLFRIAIPKPNILPAKNTKLQKEQTFSWHGGVATSARAPDGVYCAIYSARYENGNIPTSAPIKIVLDSSPPELDVSADLDVRQFTPDGDGENEEQAFRLSAQDLSALASYDLAIAEILPNAKIAGQTFVVRRFAGKGDLPQTIYWDGKSESGLIVESLTQYEYTLTATDVYGNTATTKPRRFETGVLALAEGNGFRIRIPNADLSDPINDRLGSVFRTIERYPRYKLKIEAHAASGAGIERNLKLTELAARRIAEYFIEQGIAKDRVAYQGFGDATPIYNTRGIHAAKNQRIEILLVR